MCEDVKATKSLTSKHTYHTNELSLNVPAAVRRSATFQKDIALQVHWRWIFSSCIAIVSVALLVLMICLVPFPSDLFEADYSPLQRSPYDHLNLASTVVLMMLTAPAVNALILRYHTDCQRDLTVLLVATWTAEMLSALKHLLHFLGFDQFGLGVPAALAGLLWVGLQVEHLLTHAMVDLESVLPVGFGIEHLKLLLRVEAVTICFIVLIALLDEIFEFPEVLRIVGSFFCWSFLLLGMYWAFCLRRGLSFLVREVDRAQRSSRPKEEFHSVDPEVTASICRIRDYRRFLALCNMTRLLILSHAMLFGGYLWPLPADLAEEVRKSLGPGFFTYLLTDSTLPCNLWFLSLLVGILYVMGFASLWATHRRHQEEQVRIQKRSHKQETYLPAHDPGWQKKVEDLAKRAISLDALLNFYSGLGRDYMLHYDSQRHTTDDVVRQAIIPLSAPHQSDMSKLLMKGRRVRPGAMVTHTWHSNFRDLVAAITAEALQDTNYARISSLLDTDMDLVKSWLRRTGELRTMYWICAFCVNQHSSICQPSFPIRDSITGAEVEPCNCNCPKFLNTDPPCRQDMHQPHSINCEMNKFSDMIAWLAATGDDFRQVLVVDKEFELFSRAWCVAEIAEAYMMGMKQLLKVDSHSNLQRRQAKLKALRIEDMKASRVEDVTEILSRIPDKDEFNSQLQRLFGKLFGTFWNLHPSERLKVSCRELRWQLACLEEVDEATNSDEAQVSSVEPKKRALSL